MTDSKTAERWITVEAERALYVDRGRDVILCDRLPSPVTLVLRLTHNQLAKLARVAEADPAPAAEGA